MPHPAFKSSSLGGGRRISIPEALRTPPPSDRSEWQRVGVRSAFTHGGGSFLHRLRAICGSSASAIHFLFARPILFCQRWLQKKANQGPPSPRFRSCRGRHPPEPPNLY